MALQGAYRLLRPLRPLCGGHVRIARGAAELGCQQGVAGGGGRGLECGKVLLCEVEVLCCEQRRDR